MLIDMHVHCGVQNGFSMPYSMVEKMMENYPIDHIIVSNCESSENDEDLNRIPDEFVHSQNDTLKETIAFARKHPHKISVMPWIKPVMDGVDNEFISIIEENKDIVKGIKLHSHNSNLPVDSPLLEPYIQVAKDFNLSFLVHTGGVEAASPIHVYNAAKKNPDVNFIMAHMELETDNRRAIQLISELPNLYGDTAWVSIDSVMYFLEICGSDRILFGSDAPIDGWDTYDTNRSGEPSLYLQYFNELKNMVPQEIYDKIMYKNAMKLFNIEL